ncbi:alpha-amylase family glycosyl hydrolase [Paracoccus aerius]
MSRATARPRPMRRGSSTPARWTCACPWARPTGASAPGRCRLLAWPHRPRPLCHLCQRKALMTNIPTATYRIQMRDGVDFERVTQLLPYLSDLGVSHLYLSPIFLATTGSTHGYDITDPTRIDPALGGPDGFDRLAAAARDRGLGSSWTSCRTTRPSPWKTPGCWMY